MKGNYERELKEFDYGDLMTVEEWKHGCEVGPMFIDYDGYGYAVKDDMVDTTPIAPSIRHKMPEDATHIVWFNR